MATSAQIPILSGADVGPLARDLSEERLADLYRRHGAVLLRGVAASPDDFLALSDRFGTAWVPYRLGKRRPVIGSRNHVQLVNDGKFGMPPHAELCYLPLRPDMAWFYCECAPRRGGATFLYDGLEIAAALPDGLRRLFDGRELHYPRRMDLRSALHVYDVPSREALQRRITEARWEDALRLEGDILIQDYRVPALPVLPDTGQRVFANQILFNARIRPWALHLVRWLFRPTHSRARCWRVLDRLGRLTRTRPGSGMAAYPTFEDGTLVPLWVVRELVRLVGQREMRVAWEEGDVLVFDNRRVLHGREPVEDRSRRILTRFGAPAWAPTHGAEGQRPVRAGRGPA